MKVYPFQGQLRCPSHLLLMAPLVPFFLASKFSGDLSQAGGKSKHSGRLFMGGFTGQPWQASLLLTFSDLEPITWPHITPRMWSTHSSCASRRSRMHVWLQQLVLCTQVSTRIDMEQRQCCVQGELLLCHQEGAGPYSVVPGSLFFVTKNA